MGATTTRRQSGYVLVLTIVILALLTVAATFIGQRIMNAVSLMQAEQDEAARVRAVDGAEARVVMLLATWPRGAEGLGVGDTAIPLDGRWLDAGEGVAVSLQDSRGLIDLNLVSRERMDRLLASYGLDPDSRGAAIDTVLDYRDEDDLQRLQGAEKDMYIRAGMPPPRNADLIVPSELRRVYGWKAYSALWGQDGILDHVTVGTRSPAINPNTATWRTLVAAYGLSPEAAKGLVAQRRANAWANLQPLLEGGQGADIFAATSVSFPSNKVIVTLVPKGAKWAHRFAMTLTPQAKAGGWRIDYAFPVELETQDIKWPLPKLPDVLAVPEGSRKIDGPLPF